MQYVKDLTFEAETLEGDTVEFEFTDIDKVIPVDDVFYVWGNVPCNLNSLRVRNFIKTKKIPGVYYCSSCGENPVDAENGYDTCPDCVGKV